MKINPSDFLETSVWKTIKAACKYAVDHHEPVLVYGATQIGKTTALEEYVRRAEAGTVVYTRMPAAPSLSMFVRRLALDCGKPATGAAARDNILARFAGGDTLLIVDEVHSAFIAGRRNIGALIVEYIREIYDRTGIGVVFSGTKLMFDEFNINEILNQTICRGFLKKSLPNVLPKKDIALFAAAFGLAEPDPESAAIIDRVIRNNGIGQIRSILRAASNRAANIKEPLEWKHFKNAYDIVTNQ